MLKGKDAQLRVKDDDEVSMASSFQSRVSKDSKKVKEQRDVLKRIGEKISATNKPSNSLENQLMGLKTKSTHNPVLRDDMDMESVHSKLSKLGGLSRAKSTASIQSCQSSVAT